MHIENTRNTARIITPPGIICAPATPEGYSALAVIRVSGSGSFDLIEKIMSLQQGRLSGMRRKLGIISENEEVIDEVVAFSWPAERSYTGEEMVEIICHGVPEIVRRIMDLLIRQGAEKAGKGEFTRRAFISGKLNALQIMALASVWNERSESGDISGRFGLECEEFIVLLEKAKELLEGDIEFGEPHLDSERKVILKELSLLLKAAKKLTLKATSIEAGQKVFLMGPVNSGKSTLFNLLVGGGKALVSESPGTTRDGTRESIEIRGRKILLCDTAGTDGDGLDLQASKNVLDEIQSCDKVVWMSLEGRESPSDELKRKSPEILEVASKCDLNPDSLQPSGESKQIGKLSSLTGEGISGLKEWISTSPGNMSLVGTMDRIVNHLLAAEEFVVGDEFGIASEHLNEAEREIRSTLGKGENLILSVERALLSMCVGK
ncbi:MAG: 50S ribosome-binding GTPase [Candidatus Fermentibacteraceae bacterium]|nr:50S ribosome-binding GTPase [Candidatus Fermentibacteraceae bacterium]